MRAPPPPPAALDAGNSHETRLEGSAELVLRFIDLNLVSIELKLTDMLWLHYKNAQNIVDIATRPAHLVSITIRLESTVAAKSITTASS